MNHRHDNYGPTDTNYFCAFCGKTGDQVNAMISGPNGIYICDECISVCADAMMRDMGYAMAQEVEMLEDDPRRMGWMNPPAAHPASPVGIQKDTGAPTRRLHTVVDRISPAEVLGDLNRRPRAVRPAFCGAPVVGQEQAKRVHFGVRRRHDAVGVYNAGADV